MLLQPYYWEKCCCGPVEHFSNETQDAFDVLNIFKTGVKMFWHLENWPTLYPIQSHKTEMLRNHTDDYLLTDSEYVIQLLEPSSVSRDQIFDNHHSDLGQPRSNVVTEELQRLFDIHYSRIKMHQYWVSQKNHSWKD